ncbi:hypothetical protein RR46_06223 [Papilio xuthus]|uniref:MH2 domain-containing protein n=1 Tax=Papilio xuthus TaxID=66420 RepID=A0A194QDM4_PAPXU|nr:hypothetical protein RR46_06223 [Papilio xuthus]
MISVYKLKHWWLRGQALDMQSSDPGFESRHEHIQEVLDKWTQIDDEIWAKVIVFEKNRRVAKAYARAPVLTINGSDDGFDGMREESKRTLTTEATFMNDHRHHA